MLSVLIGACAELLRSRQDFWILAGLTERSFEEGERNASFREAVDWYEKAQVASKLLAQLRWGVNRNLVDLIESCPAPPPGIEWNPTRDRERPDICYGSSADGTSARVEVKAIFDCTGGKWYPITAADGDKLRAHRKPNVPGHLFQAVFFLQLPGYDYPQGRWFPPNRKLCGPRSDYVCYAGIEKQYKALRKRMATAPAWPTNDRPFVVPLALSNEALVPAIRRWFDLVFDRSTPWDFDEKMHLADAAAGCAVWEY
jgi:hypothetical protein